MTKFFVDKVEFIDYEYCSENFRAFDIANHFCEFAGFECDYTRFPSVEMRRLWLSEYLQALRGEVRDDELDSLMDEVDAFVPVTILRSTP